MNRVIYTQDNYRVIENRDELYLIEDLKGDCFKSEYNPDIDEKTLELEETDDSACVVFVGVWEHGIWVDLSTLKRTKRYKKEQE